LTGVDVRGLAVSVVIVSWNTRDLLERCLRSVECFGAAYSDQQIIVVDNGSQDGSAQMVREQWPHVQLIANAGNEGYQRANNRGMVEATGDVLLLINADAELTDGCLDTMIGCLQRDPGVGVVGPRLVFGGGSWQRWTAGNDPDLLGAATFFLFAERVSRRAGLRSLWLTRDVSTAFEPDWVSSACVLLRRDVLRDTGLMDERFFAYMDDVDLCRRARAAGWKVRYEPSATAVHLMGQSTRRQTGAASPGALRAFNQYFALQHGLRRTRALQLIEATGFLVRAAAHRALAATHPGQPHHSEQHRDHLRNLRVALEPVEIPQYKLAPIGAPSLKELGV